MQQYAADFGHRLGQRLCTMDLDVVIVDDLTPVVTRPEPIVGWKVGHAGVYSGSYFALEGDQVVGGHFANQQIKTVNETIEKETIKETAIGPNL